MGAMLTVSQADTNWLGIKLLEKIEVNQTDCQTLLLPWTANARHEKSTTQMQRIPN